MRENKTKMGLLVAALLAMGQTSQSEPSKFENIQEDFLPIENLILEDRAALHPQIELLRKSVKIDWSSIAIGINHKGDLVLKGKEAADIKGMANPTCWAE